MKRHMTSKNRSSQKFITDKVTVYFDMFGVFMENMINDNVKSILIITIEFYRAMVIDSKT